MEHLPRHSKLRHALAPVPLAIAFVTVLALAVVAGGDGRNERNAGRRRARPKRLSDATRA